MTQNLFEQSIDQTRLDRLRGEILAFASDLGQGGYDDLEIARALLWAAHDRANRVGGILRESFLQFVRDHAAQALTNEKAILREFFKENEKNKIN